MIAIKTLKNRVLSIFLALVLALGSITGMTVLAADREPWQDLLNQPGLKPGDLLNAGADITVDYGYGDECAYVSVNDRYWPWTVREFVVVGDCFEILEAVLIYEDGRRIEAIYDYYSDGERATIYQEEPRSGMRRELFVSYRVVAGSNNSVFALVTDNRAGMSNFSSPEMVAGHNVSAPSRPTTDVSVFSIIAEFEQNFYVHTKPEMLPGRPSTWAVGEVNAAIAAGLVPQSLRSNYTQAITRAEYCALAVALYETYTGAVIAERKTFVDTNDVNVEKMAAVGVVEGVGEGRFDPDGLLRREHAATMLSRLANALGKPLPIHAATFSDNADISSWAIEGAGQVQAAGIMGGIGNNTFAPKDPYTREQSIITMIRLWNKA